MINNTFIYNEKFQKNFDYTNSNKQFEKYNFIREIIHSNNKIHVHSL
jgi:hypothetical protein